MNSTAIGRIQCQTVPVPEVGSQPRPMAKTVMPTMAIQKSGAEAPIREISETKPIEEAAEPEGGERADDDGGDRDQDDGGDRQPECPDEGLEDDVDGRTRLTQALAEVEVQHVPDIASELHEDRDH